METQGHRAKSAPARPGTMRAQSSTPDDLFPLSRLVAGPSRLPPPSPTTGPRFRTAIHYRSWADRELRRKLHDSHLRLVDTFDAIGQKYGSVPLEEDDEIDIFTGKITRDRGRLRSLESRPFAEGMEFFDEAIEDDGEAQKRWHSEPVAGPESVVFGDDEDELGDWDERSGLDPQMPPPEIEQPWTTEDLEDLNAFLRAEAASRERSASRGVDYDYGDSQLRPSSTTKAQAQPVSSPSARLEDLFLQESDEDELLLTGGQPESDWEDVTPSRSAQSSSARRYSFESTPRPSSSTGLGSRPAPNVLASRSITASQSMPNIRSALRRPTKRFSADRYVAHTGRRQSTGPRVRWSDNVDSLPERYQPSSPLSPKARGKQRMVGERPGDRIHIDADSRPVRIRTFTEVEYGCPRDEAQVQHDSRSGRKHLTPAPGAMRILSEQAWWKRRSESPAVWQVPAKPAAVTRRVERARPVQSRKHVRPPERIRLPSVSPSPDREPSAVSVPASFKRQQARPRKTPSVGSSTAKQLPSGATSSRDRLPPGRVAAQRFDDRVPLYREPAMTSSPVISAGYASSSTDVPSSPLNRPFRPSTLAKAQASATRQVELEEQRSVRRRSRSVSAKPTTPRLSNRMKRELTAAAQTPPTHGRPAALANHFTELHVLARGGVVKCHACRDAGGVRAEWAGYCRGRSRPKLCAFIEDETDLLSGDAAVASPPLSPPAVQQDSPAVLSRTRELSDDSEADSLSDGQVYPLHDPGDNAQQSPTPAPSRRVATPETDQSALYASEDEPETHDVSHSNSDFGDDAYQLSDAEVADGSEWEDVEDDQRQIVLENLPGTSASYSLPPKGDQYEAVLLYNGLSDFVRCQDCFSAGGDRAEKSVWCKGRDDAVACPLGRKSTIIRLSLRAKSVGGSPSKTDRWIDEQGDLFAPPKTAPASEPDAMDVDHELGQRSSPSSSTSARMTFATEARDSSVVSADSSSLRSTSRVDMPARAMTALPTPPRSKSISTDIESNHEFRRAATVAAPYYRPTPPPSQTPEPLSTAKRNKTQYWTTVRTPQQMPSSDAPEPSSASATSDYEMPSSEPPEPFPEDLVTRASDLGINLGPAPTGRLSTNIMAALGSPRNVEPLSAALSNGFRLTSPPPRSPVPGCSKSDHSRSEPTRSTSGLMLPPPIPSRRSSPPPSTPRKRILRDPDEEEDLPSPSPQKRRGRAPSTAPAAYSRPMQQSTPTRTKDETERELARVAAEMGDDAGLEWGLDEDAGEIAREFREGSVVVYA